MQKTNIFFKRVGLNVKKVHVYIAVELLMGDLNEGVI